MVATPRALRKKPRHVAGRDAVQPESLMLSFHVHLGTSVPLGAQSRNGGVNFALLSRHATALELLLYDAPERRSIARRLRSVPPAAA